MFNNLDILTSVYKLTSLKIYISENKILKTQAI